MSWKARRAPVVKLETAGTRPFHAFGNDHVAIVPANARQSYGPPRMSPSPPLSRNAGAASIGTRGHVGTPSAASSGAPHVPFYGVVSARTEKVVEFFLEREAAEAMIGEVKEDEPLLAEELRVEAIELG